MTTPPPKTSSSPATTTIPSSVWDNPTKVPILKRQADHVALNRLNRFALKQCDEKVRLFAECTKDKLISVVWKCKSFQKDVQKCVIQFTDDEKLKDEFRKKHAREFPRFVVGWRDSTAGDEEASGMLEREGREVDDTR